MLALEQWGRGKPEYLAIFAHAVALSADPVCAICMLSRKREFRERFARIEDKRKWVANYRRQSFLSADPNLVAEFMGATEGVDGIEAIEDLLAGIQDFAQLTPKRRNKIAREIAADFRKSGFGWEEILALQKDFDRMTKEVYREHLAELKKNLTDKPSTNEDNAVKFVTGDVRFRFFVLVVIPCWLEYGRGVEEVYREACQGDFRSLCMLLNLDPLALEDRKIRNQFNLHLENSNDYRRKQLHSALRGSPLKKLRRRKVKILLAALVYKIFLRVDEAGALLQKRFWKAEGNRAKVRRCKLTFPQVHRLFDAAYKDSHKDAKADVDLEMADEVFKKAIQRALPFWPDFA